MAPKPWRALTGQAWEPFPIRHRFRERPDRPDCRSQTESTKNTVASRETPDAKPMSSDQEVCHLLLVFTEMRL